MKRIPIVLVAGVATVLFGAGCGSDQDASDTSLTAVGSTTSIANTATTQPNTTTTAASSATAAPATSTSTTLPSSGGRVVTSPSDNVKLGDTGPGVEQIQAALKAAGYKIDVDGEFGPVTQKAVKDFQSKNGLTVDGVVGPKTWAKLGSPSGATTTTG